MKCFPVTAMLVVGIFVYGNAAHGYTLVQEQQLNFGTIGMRNTPGAKTVTVEPDGDVVYGTDVIAGTPRAQPGRYRITGLAPNMTMTFGVSMPPTDGGYEVDNATGLSNGPNTDFVIDTFTATTNTPSTSPTGEIMLYVGATLRIANGGTYGNGTYNGTLDITFNYE
jgi:Domain of unknown function (DUF4402)